MKYLLSILVLFSGLSFSNIYLVCDEPYTFYPDKEARELLVILDKIITNTYIERYDWKEEFDKAWVMSIEINDLVKETDKYKWFKSPVSGIYGRWLDRSTLILHTPFTDTYDSEKPKCKVVSSSEYTVAKKELDKIAEDLNNKSEKEYQEKLDKRKI